MSITNDSYPKIRHHNCESKHLEKIPIPISVYTLLNDTQELPMSARDKLSGKNEIEDALREINSLPLKVRSKKWGKPDNAFVSVPYRGAWFYIADDDLNSKSTFTLLKQLFSLQAGQIKEAGPTLTLPVGGG